MHNLTTIVIKSIRKQIDQIGACELMADSSDSFQVGR